MVAVRQRLDATRWHFQHGPIDLVIGADGEAPALQAAHEAAWGRFAGVLEELVAELPALRRPVSAEAAMGTCGQGAMHSGLQGEVARRMWAACLPLALQAGRPAYITPMAAVAGAVAEEIVAAYRRPGIARAWVNNGGDIAVHLAPGQALRVGLCAELARLDLERSTALGPDGLAGRFELGASQPARGVATSGWRGRSFSLGIADAVTVLADTAAQADAAATVIANAVDVDAPGIRRRPASALKDDSDLGDIPVTVDVPRLAPAQVEQALQAGARRARELRARGLIRAAVLVCQGQVGVIGSVGPVGLPGHPAATESTEARQTLSGSVFA
jgi:ApbE superfamily uncharacterized protein (UPF0280 family)